MTPRRWLAAVTLVLCLAPLAAAQTSGSSQDGTFRIEWQPYGLGRASSSIEGWVYNQHRYRIGGVRLKVEGLDAAGNTIGETSGWVYGNISSGGKGYFTVSAPKGAAAYRVTVVSFNLIALEGP